jgi:outer membrane protein OmpA-like peptidoglycan-associated protein
VDREALAKAETEAEARLRAQAENEQRIEADGRARAELERNAAESETATVKLEAEAARLAAQTEADRVKRENDAARDAAQAEADRLRLKAEAEKAELRAQLLSQFNLVLETRDTARGLIVNMSDVLFDTAKYTLRPEARERLAKVAGILLGHQGLKLEVEGHTDSVGGEAYNQNLSEQRAGSVRDYLIHQGISRLDLPPAKGFGKSQPVATNDTATGRQRNRRVEIIVSGELIGTQIALSTGSQ